jgi:hypothetical protein
LCFREALVARLDQNFGASRPLPQGVAGRRGQVEGRARGKLGTGYSHAKSSSRVRISVSNSSLMMAAAAAARAAAASPIDLADNSFRITPVGTRAVHAAACTGTSGQCAGHCCRWLTRASPTGWWWRCVGPGFRALESTRLFVERVRWCSTAPPQPWVCCMIGSGTRACMSVRGQCVGCCTGGATATLGCGWWLPRGGIGWLLWLVASLPRDSPHSAAAFARAHPRPAVHLHTSLSREWMC